MRKLYLYILGIFLILPFAIQAQTEKRIKIACVGNSITEGFLLKNPSEEVIRLPFRNYWETITK